LREFVTGIMPKEITAEPWYEKRRKQMLTTDNKSKQKRGSIETSMFRQKVSNAVPTRTPKQLCALAYSRIVSLSKRPTDQLRRIRQIFALSADATSNQDQNSNGTDLTPAGLRRQLAKIEVLLKDEEVIPLFNHLDVDGDGGISMQEFLIGVMPKDITRINIWDKREADRVKKANVIKTNNRKNISRAADNMRSDARPELNITEIKTILLDKINQLASKPTDRLRKVSQIFKRGKEDLNNIKDGVSLTVFKSHIEKLGLTLTEEQAVALFLHFDDDDSGTVSLHEFLSKLLPQDYSKESWHEKSQKIKM